MLSFDRLISKIFLSVLLFSMLPFLHGMETSTAFVVQGQLKTQPKSVEIESLWESGKKSKAERVLNKWMGEDKKSPWPWVQAASIYFREKKFKKALSYTKTAIEKGPQCAEAYYWRGRSYEAMNQPMEAANEYRAALIAEETFQEAREGLDRVQALLGS